MLGIVKLDIESNACPEKDIREKNKLQYRGAMFHFYPYIRRNFGEHPSRAQTISGNKLSKDMSKELPKTLDMENHSVKASYFECLKITLKDLLQKYG